MLVQSRRQRKCLFLAPVNAPEHKRWHQVSKFGNVLQPSVPPRLILSLAVAGGWFILIHNRRMKWIPTLISRLRAALHQEVPEPRVPQGTSAPQPWPPPGNIPPPAFPPKNLARRGSFRKKGGSVVDRARAGLPASFFSASPDL